MRLLTVLAISLLAISITAVWLVMKSAPSPNQATAVPVEAGDPVPVLADDRIPQFFDQWAGKPVMNFEHAKGLLKGRINNAPKLGELAPNFTLVDSLTGEAVSLRQLHSEKPVVVYFASYSCHISHSSANDMARIANRFKDAARFIVVYIREAHPEGGYQPTDEGKRFVVPAPFDFASRIAAAQRFAGDEKFNFPVLVDSMDDAVAARWAAWPVRLFVVNQSGKIVFAGQQGPWFFQPTKGFDPNVPKVPEGLRDLPGYSKESLEEFLQAYAAQQART